MRNAAKVVLGVLVQMIAAALGAPLWLLIVLASALVFYIVWTWEALPHRSESGSGPVLGPPEAEADVTISPDDFILTNAAGWKIRTAAHVTNRTAKPLYSVWIKVWAHGSLKSAHLEVTLDEPVFSLTSSVKGVEVSADALILDGVDQDGREAKCIRLFELLPGAPRRLIVSGGAGCPNRSRASAYVMGAQDEPDRVFERGDLEAGVTFSVPEAFTARGVGMKMKGKS